MVIPAERQTKLIFDPGPHKYYDDEGVVYTSVTTLIGKYKKQFNKKYWGMYTALKNAGYYLRPDMQNEQYITVDGIRRHINDLYENPINAKEVELTVKEWQRLTDIACERGNVIHNRLENTINQSKGDSSGSSNTQIKPRFSLEGQLKVYKTKHDLESTGIQHTQPLIYWQLLHYINKGCTLYAEKKTFSTSFQVAGTIDVLIVKDNRFGILDWKTNKDPILFESGYYKKVLSATGEWYKTGQFVGTDNRLFAPLSHLPDCKGSIYSLQLNTYAYLMIRWGYKLVKNALTICHMMPGEKPKLISVPLLLNEVDDLMKHHYRTRVIGNEEGSTHFGII